jgi:hypothetical protein
VPAGAAVITLTFVSPTRSSRLELRVAAAAEEALARQRFVTAIDVLHGIGWLPTSLSDSWRQGRVSHLSEVLPVAPGKLAAALEHLARWAQRQGLSPRETDYVSATRDRKPLRFTADGDAETERACRITWFSPGLPDARQEQIAQRRSAPPDLLAILPVNDWACADCGGGGDFLTMEGAGPLCLTCADMDHLVFLPAGDAALTRRARKASGLSAVVVRWSRTRRRYERRGLLVEEAALAHAEEQCLADQEARKRRRERDAERRAREDEKFTADLTKAIRRLFPRCPTGRAAAIAQHTSLRGSGRVGRSAAARALDEDAVTVAVAASVRHEDTGYDSLLMSGVPRNLAREQVRPDISRVLTSWARHN